ncbi:MAG TPA: signal recognition particle receptor subunit alpha [Nitrososphaerales archaeon]|nr:signal recognition particle receptor subunit alpha [Nitrososphaerales archaeon]
MLDKIKDGLQSAINRLVGAPTVDEKEIKEFVRDVQRTLLYGDVNVKIVIEVCQRIEKRALEEKPPPGLPRKDHIVKILYEEFQKTLGEEGRLDLPTNRMNTLLMIGIQGSGKTTTVGKLSRLLSKRGYRVGVVAADTFRPGAITQLKTLCSSISVPVYDEGDEKDSSKVAKRGLEYFAEQRSNLVIVDTAGRHKEERGLLDEMVQISKAVSPDMVFLVVDGTIGQAAFAQAAAFHKAVPVGGIILTKMDGAAKGGGALAAAAATGARVFYMGTGERIDDLEPFSPTRFVGRLLGMGDLQALLERAKDLESLADEKQVKRMMSGKLTMNDFLTQIESVKKMGSLRKILESLPGFSQLDVKEQNIEEIEGKMKYWRAMIQAMTKVEREDPDLLNSQRVKRIARGTGVTERDVKDLLARYRQAKTVMKASKGREFRAMMKQMNKQ